MLYNFFKKFNTEVIIIKMIDDHNPDWGGNGIVFYVKNGKGLLSMKYGHLENDALATLIFGNTPLIKFHGEGPYFCPTCEKLVAAGYGLNMSNQQVISELRDILNRKFVSLEESVENLKPLLGLLPTGYYALVDTELCPTDGNGNFFWKLNNKPFHNKASCPIYAGEGIWSEEIPYYILPTQPTSLYNPQRAEDYRNNDNYRAIAYYMEGYLCGLIDGHHKAVAAALDKKKVKTLVIIPTTSISVPNDKQNFKGGISINGTFFSQEELLIPVSETIKSLKLNQLKKEETEKYLSMYNNDFDQHYNWPPEILEAEKIFPDVITVARQQCAGDISDERLDRIIKSQESISDQDALNIATALYYTQKPRFKEMAFYFCRNYTFASVWYKIYELLANIIDGEVEDFFIDYLVQDEKKYPEINRIIDTYFSS